MNTNFVKIKNGFTIFLIISTVGNAFSQNKQTQAQYIEKYHKIAIKKMQEYKIPASITLAQGILESGNGNSLLATKAKNHFGIKCHKNWNGKKIYYDDDKKGECFRHYKNVEQSFDDHSLFLTSRGRYEFLFTEYATSDYINWAKGLKKAGYATNPKYPKLLIDIIEKNQLYVYDKKGFKEKPSSVEDEMLVLEDIEDEEFTLEQTNKYIKALMGQTVYYSDAEKGIFIFNRIKTIKANRRTPLEIAVEFDISLKRILKYNDINNDGKFTKAQNVFLQPKRFHGSQKTYLVKPGDTMWEISQMFGIKLKSLFKKNLLNLEEQVAPGQTLNLKKKKKKKPRTISFSEVLKKKKTILENKPTTSQIKPKKLKESETINNIIDNTEKKEIKVVKEKRINNPAVVEKPEIEKLSKESTTKTQDIIEKNKEPEFNKHIVEQGQTMYFISKLYKISIEEIVKLNKLQNTKINIGQVLLISKK